MPVGLEVDGIIFSEMALFDRQSHAATLGRIFTSWSLIEASIASLLGLMMHTDHNAALALLGTFKSNSARIDAVRKTGKELLEASLFNGFDEVMKDVLSYAEERNAIAHGVWGSSKEKPEILYHMPMKNFTRFLIETVSRSAEQTLAEVESFKTAFTTFTLDDLERIEQRGRDVLSRAMAEAMKMSYSRALESQTKTK